MPRNKPDASSQSKEDKYSLLALDQHLCFALYMASNKLTRFYNLILEPLDLTFPQYLVMILLWEKTPQSVGECAKALDLKSSTITPLIKRLETRGLIDRAREAMDERRVLVNVTQRGLALREKAVGIRKEVVRKLNISDEEAHRVRMTLKGLFNGI
jgi:DNA-binding MarR family transcriptional regulator